MNFYNPIYQYASHSFCNGILILHVLNLRLIICLRFQQMIHYVLTKLTDILRISSISIVTFLNSLLQVIICSLFKLLSNCIYIILKFSFFVNFNLSCLSWSLIFSMFYSHFLNHILHSVLRTSCWVLI